SFLLPAFFSRYVSVFTFCTFLCVFFFNDTATTEIYTLSLHDALPISPAARCITRSTAPTRACPTAPPTPTPPPSPSPAARCCRRSEEHTSELQSRGHLVCRLLLEKKKKTMNQSFTSNEAPNITW